MEAPMRRPGARGQSTLEYILVLSAIVAAVVVAANGVINPAVQQVITDARTTINQATDRLDP